MKRSPKLALVATIVAVVLLASAAFAAYAATETALAKALGVDGSKVAAALEPLRPPGAPPGGQGGLAAPQGAQPQPPLQAS